MMTTPTHFAERMRFTVVAGAICAVLGSALALELALLEPQAALAQPAPQAEIAATKLKEAKAEFRKGEIEAALAAIEEGLAAVPTYSPALLLKGQILLEARAYADAITAYEAFLDSKPRGANKRKAQKIVRNLKVIRRTKIVVTTDSADNGPADVFIDSKSLSRVCVASPSCTVGFVPGKYVVIVARDGFVETSERIVLRAGKTIQVAAKLVEKPSALTIKVTPKDATITIDGAPFDLGDLNGDPDGDHKSSLAPGSHKLELARAGYASHTESVLAELGKPIAVEVVLAERVSVEVSPGDVELLLDGAPVALENGLLTLPKTVGPFKLSGKKEGFDTTDVEIPRAGPRDKPFVLTLPPTPEPVTAPPPPETAERRWTTLQLGLLGGAGVVALTGFVGSGIFGLSANSHKGDADSLCGRDEFGLACSTQEGFDEADAAQTAASRSNIFFGLGTVGVVAGLAALNMNDVEPWSLRRKVSIGATASIGVLALTVGSIYGVRARGEWEDSQDSCDGSACDRPGFIKATTARDSATVANTGFAIAGVAAAATAYLWFSRPSEGEPVIAPTPIASGGGLALSGKF